MIVQLGQVHCVLGKILLQNNTTINRRSAKVYPTINQRGEGAECHSTGSIGNAPQSIPPFAARCTGGVRSWRKNRRGWYPGYQIGPTGEDGLRYINWLAGEDGLCDTN